MKEIHFYKLTYSLETKEVGHVKQLEGPVLRNYDPKSPYNYHNLNSTSFMDKKPELDVFKLYPSSKKTDFLSSQLSPSIGFFISNKVVCLLEDYRIVGGRIYKVDIFTNDEKKVMNDYNFIHLVDDYSIIDYSRSKFVDFSEDNKEVAINSDQGIHLPPLVETKMLFLSTIPDIFRLPYDVFILISASLKEKFEKENISGIEIAPFNHINFFGD